MGNEKKDKWEVVLSPEVEKVFKNLPPEARKEIEDKLKEIAERGPPEDAEESKPCRLCSSYFFHSDVFCPSCGSQAQSKEREENVGSGLNIG